MVVKVYISGISGNKEVKKRQQRVLMILDSKNIKYEIIDITEPGREDDKDFMQNNSKSNGGTVSDPNPRTPLPPQVFNDEEYCGDYDQFDLANEVDTLEQFLKVEAPPEETPTENQANAVNGDVQNNEGDQESKQEVEKTENKVETEENTADSKETPADANNDVKDNLNKEASVDREVSVEKAASVERASVEKAASVEKETSPVSQKTADNDEVTQDKPDKSADETEVESKQISKENTPAPGDAVNENGSIGSREQSAEKEEAKKQNVDDPSVALIQSEQVASTE